MIDFKNMVDAREYPARRANCIEAGLKHGGFKGLTIGDYMGLVTLKMPDGTPIIIENGISDRSAPNAKAWRISPECYRIMCGCRVQYSI